MTRWCSASILFMMGCSQIYFMAGCQKDDRMAIKKILVDVDEGVEEFISREKARGIFEKSLNDHELFRVGQPDSEGLVARLYLHSFSMGPSPSSIESAKTDQKAKGLPSSAQKNVLTVALSVALKDVDGKRKTKTPKKTLQGHGAGTTTISGAIDVASVSEPLVMSAIQKAFHQIEGRHRLGKQSSEALITSLERKDQPRENRLSTIELLGAREEKDAIPVLIEHMKSEDREMAQYAVGALARIGAPSAVDDLIHYSTGKPASMRKLVIEAMRKAGTKKAKAWLFTLSTGHPDPEVQLAAKSALAAVTADQANPAGPNQLQ